jgi:hypothetical protein
MVDKFTAIKAMLNGEKVENFSIEDAVKFLDSRIEQTEKKNASGGGERKPTKTQLENEVLKEQIVQYLSTCTEPVDVGTVCKAIGIESNQKVSALLTQLRKVGTIERTEVKGKPYFALAQ